jgi:uncharacterized repeat protein (TIGR01451 family)
MNTKQVFFAVNRVSQLATAGKLTGLWSSHARGVAKISTPFVVALASLAFSAAPASAEVAPAPAWQTTVVAFPTVQPAGIGRKGRYDVVLENVGAKTSEGEVTVKDVLPAGLSATSLKNAGGCAIATRSEVLCAFSPELVPSGFAVVTIEYEVTGALALGSSLVDVATVSGGGAEKPARGEAVTTVGGEHSVAPPGVLKFAFQPTGPAGEPFERAGGHPNFVTTTLLLNDERNESESFNSEFKPVEPVKDLEFYLPLGFLGDVSVAGQCPPTVVELEDNVSGCPPSSEVGTILAMISYGVYAAAFTSTHEPFIYNMVPEKGYAAEFAFASNNLTFFLYASVVRRDGQYVVRIAVPGLPAVSSFVGSIVTFYGDIAEHFIREETGEPASIDRGAFLTDPSDCEASPQALGAQVDFDTWTEPGKVLAGSATPYPQLEGCGLLTSGFSAMLSAAPDTSVGGDTTQADEPSGYKLDLQTPQAPDGRTGLGSPPYKDVGVTFPEGVSLSPGAANGLVACPAAGPHGIDFPSETTVPGAPGGPAGEGEEIGADGLARPAAGHCPGSSQIATARASSPLLQEELVGHLFLAEPECGNAAHSNPCTPEDAANGTLYRLYLELETPKEGVVIKLPGKAMVNPSTGRITTIFEDTPQFPVSDLSVEMNGGPRAPLANPQSCGSVATTGSVTPWSAPFTPAASLSSSFSVTGCSGGFAPAFSAGSTSTQAGAHSPFTFTLKREDGEQNIDAISTTLPQGLLASVANVAQCPEPQASQGGCPSSSEVGTTTVGVGPGQDPYYTTGHVFFTGPYNGAPFGLSIVVPAVAGPFNLGNVIVRVGLHINPNTAQVTATSSPLPQIIDGAPLRIRTINVTLNNPAFTFNPTNCSQLNITGTVASTQGASANVSSPFAAAGCKSLPFKPRFSATTVANASKAHGASLDVRVTSKGGPQAAGEEANIRSVKVDLPKQLPSRLTTLQKACTEAQFVANPAGCPKESDIGTASASTPVLAHPLAGPAYLVSHGGAAFPDLEIVLQGEGVTLVLDGNTNIKKGITSSDFKTVPDAPISSFELKLPTGKYSVLGANLPEKARYDFCGQALSMPTEIVAQNGMVLKQTTKIGVNGCPKVKKKAKPKKHKKKATKSTRRGK